MIWHSGQKYFPLSRQTEFNPGTYTVEAKNQPPKLSSKLCACATTSHHSILLVFLSPLTLTIQEMIETNVTMSINVHGQHGQRSS